MKKRYSILSLLLVLIIIFGMIGCKKETPLGDSSANKSHVETSENNKDEMKKIVSLSPSVTQVLVDLGLEDQLVAVDPYSLPMIQDQSLLTFDIMKPDAEKLANLEPDLVLATGMSQKDGEDPLKLLTDLDITVVYIPVSETIEGIKSDLRTIAKTVGAEEQGEKLIAQMETDIAELEAIGKTITDKKTVYFEISPAPQAYTFGGDVYLNEMIEIIGAENVFQKESGWMSITPEAIVAANPDVIITNVDYLPDSDQEIMERAGFQEITAVKEKQVFVVTNQTSSYSNHKIVDGMWEIAELIYPQEYQK